MTKLFVGNLPWATDDQALRQLFEKFGEVLSAQVVINRFNGRSKGFGFVEFTNEEDAQKAVSELDNTEYEGRNIRVSVARPKEDRPENPYRSNEQVRESQPAVEEAQDEAPAEDQTEAAAETYQEEEAQTPEQSEEVPSQEEAQDEEQAA